MRPLFFILLLWLCGGVALPATAAVPEDGERRDRSENSVLYLLGNQAAAITVTRAGTDGSSDPYLAKALGVPNSPGRKLGKGVYAPSKLEVALHGMLKGRSSYRALETLLNPDDEIQPKAHANFAVDFARTTVTEVEYVEGKRRRSYFFELGVSFRVLDAQGREAFSREFVHFSPKICIIESANAPCKNERSKRPIDPVATWRSLLNGTFDSALQGTVSGLEAWAGLLSRLKARVELRLFGERLRMEKQATYIRNKRLAEFPYLFLAIKPVGVDGFIKDLKARGAEMDRRKTTLLQRHATTMLRNALDRSLQTRLRRTGSVKQAGIFLLPDSEAIWFKDALSRIVSDAVNYGDFEIVIDDAGERKELASDPLEFGRPCGKKGPKQRGDLCIDVVSSYKQGKTHAAKPHGGVQEAQQLAAFFGALRDPYTAQYYPRDLSRNERILSGASKSDHYTRVVGADRKQNDDRIYLLEAALKALQELGQAMAGHGVRTFNKELLN
jgi:hypothetical protein